MVVLLMLIPLLAPSPDGAQSGGIAKIAQALGLAAIKACACIVGITAGGRLLLQPLYNKVGFLWRGQRGGSYFASISYSPVTSDQ